MPDIAAASRWLAALGFSLAVGGAQAATPPLYAIGADDAGIGRVFTPVLPAEPGTPLGDGSLAFNGGLAWLPGAARFYTIANDGFGQSALTSFERSAPSTLAASTALGSGFYGGLAADPVTARLYAIASDTSSASTLYRVDPTTGSTAIGAVGVGYYGGLGFDTDDGALYAISGDDSGVQRRINRIALAADGTATATALFDLGDGSVGFAGGLAYDADGRRFVSIGSDASGASALYAFTLTGGAGSLTDLGVALAPGFVHAGLAFAVPAVPEPGTAWLFATALLPLLRRSWRTVRA